MSRVTCRVILAMMFATLGRCDDVSKPDTLVRIYSVGDLVSADAVNKRSSYGTTTIKEWNSEYPETLTALNELREVVESLASEKPTAVKAYSPSLSLIVRHSKSGHAEIEELLTMLRQNNTATVRVEFRALFSDESELKKEGVTTEQSERVDELVDKQQFTREESAELLAIIPKKIIRQHSVNLKSGRRTPWGDFYERPLLVKWKELNFLEMN